MIIRELDQSYFEKLKARGLDTIFLMTERSQPAYEFYKYIGFTELPELTAFAKELGE